jgi:hypothetical protein
VKLKHLRVERFRGIRQLDWKVVGDTICLIGRGDSAKSTILDAIEFVLSPRWNPLFSDSDFYEGNCENPIVITTTIGELPGELLIEDKFGLYQRGWDREDGLVDEPDDGHEIVLTVTLIVDKSLEPQWSVIADRYPQGKNITSKDRERLGVRRLGADVDRELSWGRGSAIAKFTEDLDNLGKAIAEAHRCARNTFAAACTPNLDEAARKAQKAAAELGVYSASGAEYRPGLDTKVISPGVGAICLHEGEIPLRSTGLGSRRLTALALQRSGVAKGTIALIDEIEHGLEPYRIRNLLRLLQSQPIAAHHGEKSHEPSLGQVITVTHSPVVVRELTADQIHVVRKDPDGLVRVLPGDSELQPLLRACPSAFLSRRIIICEGRTEVGLLRALEDFWAVRHEGLPSAHFGVEFVEGGGRNHGPKRALQLAELSYEVAYFGDSDEPIDPDQNTLDRLGVRVLLWTGQVSVEQRICLDLPWDALQEVIDLAIEIRGEFTEDAEQSVLSRVANKLGVGGNPLSRKITDWLSNGFDEDSIRKAIGDAAKGNNNKKAKGWFKELSAGHSLGRIVAHMLPQIPDSALASGLKELEDWMYAG